MVYYINENFGTTTRKEFVKGGRYVDTLLKTHPYIGRIEPFLTTFYFFRTNQNEFQYQS